MFVYLLLLQEALFMGPHYSHQSRDLDKAGLAIKLNDLYLNYHELKLSPGSRLINGYFPNMIIFPWSYE